MKLALWTLPFLVVSATAHATDDGADDNYDNEGPLSNCANHCLNKGISASGCDADDFSCQCNDGKEKFISGFMDCVGSSSDCRNITLSDSDIQAFASDRCDILIQVSSLDSLNNSTTTSSASTSTISFSIRERSKSTTSSHSTTPTTVADTGNGTTDSMSKPKVSINPSEADSRMAIRQGLVGRLAAVVAIVATVLM